MTTTALVPYNPDAVDSGRGLRFSRGWLVSTPSAPHVRWLAPWLQSVIADAWNLPALAVHALIRDPWLRHRAGFGAAAVVTAVAMTVNPTLGFTVGVLSWIPLAWRLTVELAETREVAR